MLVEVSLLFADHPDLLMKFTYFLLDSVENQAKERLARAAKESEMRRRGNVGGTGTGMETNTMGYFILILLQPILFWQ